MNGQTLRILQISTYDIAGGAEKIAWDLFTSYRDLGHHSWLAVGRKKSLYSDVFFFPNWLNQLYHCLPMAIRNLPHAEYIRRKCDVISHPKRFHAYLKGHENFYYPETLEILNIVPEHPDILHCHNLHGGYFDLSALPRLSHQIPTVLTLHDAWLLSGHCAHSFDCERWMTGCGNCPYLSLYPSIRRDGTAYNWKRKAEIYKNSLLNIVTPSQWLMDKVNKSMLESGIVASKVIPNGVDQTIFHPGLKNEARERLGLPSDRQILLFAANGIRKNIWKDYRTLQSALKIVAKNKGKVICIALGEDAPAEFIGDVEIRFVPYLRDPETIACFYQAADLYIHPSRADTFPTTILEALSCGTPVVASEVGGIPEQVIDGKNGYLVPVGDAQAMAQRILWLLENEGPRREMGETAAEIAAYNYGLERMVGDYIDFYRDVIKNFPVQL